LSHVTFVVDVKQQDGDKKNFTHKGKCCQNGPQSKNKGVKTKEFSHNFFSSIPGNSLTLAARRTYRAS
jgi:hypothetical protein